MKQSREKKITEQQAKPENRKIYRERKENRRLFLGKIGGEVSYEQIEIL